MDPILLFCEDPEMTHVTVNMHQYEIENQYVVIDARPWLNREAGPYQAENGGAINRVFFDPQANEESNYKDAKTLCDRVTGMYRTEEAYGHQSRYPVFRPVRPVDLKEWLTVPANEAKMRGIPLEQVLAEQGVSPEEAAEMASTARRKHRRATSLDAALAEASLVGAGK